VKKFVLFGTSACHLCEVAEGMLHEALRASGDLEMEKVDISDSDELFERYGILIPVIAHPDGRELRWPFQEDELLRFLGS
jgi:Glutaredoxin-like domain (DUF836)